MGARCTDLVGLPRGPGASRIALVLVAGAACMACHGYRVSIVEPARVSPFGGPAELGTVCVLRPQAFAALAQAVHTDNGEVVGVTQGGRVFFCYLAHPGRHRLTARTDNEPELDVVVRAGEPLFIRLQLNMGPDDLFEISGEEARDLLAELDYVVATPTASHVRPVTEEPVPAL